MYEIHLPDVVSRWVLAEHSKNIADLRTMSDYAESCHLIAYAVPSAWALLTTAGQPGISAITIL